MGLVAISVVVGINHHSSDYARGIGQSRVQSSNRGGDVKGGDDDVPVGSEPFRRTSDGGSSRCVVGDHSNAIDQFGQGGFGYAHVGQNCHMERHGSSGELVTNFHRC